MGKGHSMSRSAWVDDLVCCYLLSLRAKNLHMTVWFFPTRLRSILLLLRLYITNQLVINAFHCTAGICTKVIPANRMLISIKITACKQLTCLHHHPHVEHVQHSHFLQSQALFHIFFCLASHTQPTNLQ